MENKQTPAPEQAPEIKEGFFLRRPIFSTVISLIITLVGAIAISVLPVEQYPDLTPPQVEVNATYTGASANVIAETVASLLESQINGVDNMIYMNSVSSGTGSMSLTVSFNVGTDPDQATIDVNNRVQLALAQLPQEVQRMGVSVLKKSSSMLQIIFLDLAGSAVQHHLSQQLRIAEHRRRAETPSRRGRCQKLRGAGLFHAGVAQARRDEPARGHARGHRHRLAGSERPVRGGPHGR